MSFLRILTIDVETIISGIVLWFAGTCCALFFGCEFVPSLLGSLLTVCLLCLSFVIASDSFQRFVSTPLHALLFFACGMFVVLLSFGGDCIVGSMNSSGEPLLHACISKSGIGIVFTVAAVFFAIGVPIIGLLRGVVAAVWRRSRKIR